MIKDLQEQKISKERGSGLSPLLLSFLSLGRCLFEKYNGIKTMSENLKHAVRTALEKDGWTIRADPYELNSFSGLFFQYAAVHRIRYPLSIEPNRFR